MYAIELRSAKEAMGDAVNTACYLINKSPLAPLNFKTPDAVCYGSSYDYSKLKVFGCLALAHIKINWNPEL